MEYGISWLTATFGAAYRPRHAWQIDPSGHALLTPTLMASLGFDSLVIDRVPDPVRQALRANLSLQFVWQGVNTSTVASPAILAFILDSFYCTVGLDGTTPAEQAASFYADIQRRMRLLRPDSRGSLTMLWPWGCDFAFQDASSFAELTDVLTYMRAHASEFVNVTARFGTLSNFFDTLHAQPIAFPVQGARDFHPVRAGLPHTLRKGGRKKEDGGSMRSQRAAAHTQQLPPLAAHRTPLSPAPVPVVRRERTGH